jgi:hypothetical protein
MASLRQPSHAPGHVLNAQASPPSLDPLALARQILTEARAVRGPEQCRRLNTLTGQLHGIEPERIDGDDARIAFWVNLYNALVVHCLCLHPLHGSLLFHLRLFDRVAYRVGRHAYPLNLIENGVLRANRRPPYRRRRPLRDSDPRLTVAPSAIEPRIHFALNCGARSCPPIRAYEPESLDEQLDDATRAYLESESRLEPERRRVTLPRLMRLYAADFGDRDEQIRFAARYLPQLAVLLGERAARIRVEYGRFDWSVAAMPSA